MTKNKSGKSQAKQRSKGPLKGRLFIAVPIEEDARWALADHLDDSAPGGRLPGRVVRPESWHLTLRFLGDTSVQDYDTLMPLLRAVDFGPAFTLVFSSLGAFPKPERARVLWVGTSAGADRLTELAALVEEQVAAAGFEPERRPFRSHLTVSRLRPDRDVRDLLAAVPAADIPTAVDEVVAYRSHLGPGGARYEALARFPLRQL
jgi:2'-5' RNA ligase